MPLLAFNAASVRRAPRSTGTYFLYRGRELLCAGVAAGGASLRSELQARLGDKEATHFTWITADDALAAYHMQLAAYVAWGLNGSGPARTVARSAGPAARLLLLERRKRSLAPAA